MYCSEINSDRYFVLKVGRMRTFIGKPACDLATSTIGGLLFLLSPHAQMTQANVLLFKHREFEAAAARMKGGRRCIVKTPRGIAQHLVETDMGVLRWPVSYGTGPPKVRHEALSSIQDEGESDRVMAQLRDELGLS